MKELCTVVVNSCDRYEEAWYPFFTLIKKYWPERKMPIVLNTETKQYEHGGIDIQCINTKECITWSARLINVLSRIKTKYVILLLEDFFLQSPVKEGEIFRCIDYMEQNPQIATFYFKHITGHDRISEYPGYNEMDNNRKYILNCQAAVWNRETLIALLNPSESPWDMEERAHLRVEDLTNKFYCSNVGTYTDSRENVFDYLWAVEAGYGICKSKWLWNNKKLFRKNDIEMKYSQLAEMSYMEYIIGKIKERIKRKRVIRYDE